MDFLVDGGCRHLQKEKPVSNQKDSPQRQTAILNEIQTRSLESKTKVVCTTNSYGPFIDRANPLTVKQLDNKAGSLLKTFEARYTSEKANLSASERSTIDRCLYDVS
jgi:cystathionine beta-lyase family protein involved in aluminum resistance